jgi:protein polybromo-1
LSRAEKQKYEERASKLNEEKETAYAAGIDPATIGPGSQRYKENAAKAETDLAAATLAMKKDPNWIFECGWDECEWQFEDALDLIEHSVQEPNGHVPSYFKNQTAGERYYLETSELHLIRVSCSVNLFTELVDLIEGEFQCHWRNCGRVKKQANPFPSLNRLLKHVREIHILKGNGRIIHSDMRSK